MSALPTDYRSLVSELQKRAAIHGQPVSGTFELTERCNLSCRMCYVRRPAGDAAARSGELSATAWLRLAHEAVQGGMVFLLLTGGEAFLRPDFFDIYTPLTRLGLVLTLFTNGTLITDRIARRLADAPPALTEITLYGATAATYEAITGVPGSYARCWAGVDALVRHGVPLRLKATITRQNVGELETMRELAHARGLSFSAGWLLTRRRDRSASAVEDCRLSAEDCVELEANDRASADEWIEAALRQAPSGDTANFDCHAGRSSFVVTSAGEMGACLDLLLPAARPLEIGFGGAWKQVQGFVRTAPPLASACFACQERLYCPRCPAWSSLETGTLTEPVPYLCGIARARHERYLQHG